MIENHQKERKEMKKEMMIEMIERFRDSEFQNIHDFREDSDKNFDFQMNNSQFIRFSEMIESNYDSELKIRENEKDSDLFRLEDRNDRNEFIIIYREYQKKIEREKDIKIISESKENYSLKLIFHIDKNMKKEYRIFLSYKDKNNKSSKIRRLRLRNSEIKLIERNEDKMKKIFKEIMKLDSHEEIEKRYIK